MPRISSLPTINAASAPALLLVLCAGCVTVTRIPPTNTRPAPDEPVRLERETRSEPIQATVATTDRTIDITAAVPSSCRTVRVTPQVADVKTERNLTPGGWVGQLALGAGAVGFGAGGGFLLGQPCVAAAAAGAPCIRQVQDATKVVGVASLVVAGVFATALLGNGMAAIDTTAEVPDRPKREPGRWATCGWQAAAGARVEVWFPGGYGVSGKMDGRGRASLDLSFIAPNAQYVADSQATVRVDGIDVGDVSFRNTELFRRSVEIKHDTTSVASAPP